MVNLFTGQVVSGGWPVDWWANHRSPFSLMTAVEIAYSRHSLDPCAGVHGLNAPMPWTFTFRFQIL